MPRHLIPPTNVTIFGRRVMVTGCDNQTQRYLLNHYGIDNVPSMKVIETTKPDESGSSGRAQSDIVPRPKTRCGLLNLEDATNTELYQTTNMISEMEDPDKFAEFLYAIYHN
ncbi:uncharacterized protein [Panulirus ornatus]|uniref:uncharacterized protein n=1 Tax=Panulirus ornatus TaxID=150431 RepID=UPI003A86E44C